MARIVTALGELAALRCCDIDTDAGSVRVARQLTATTGQPPQFGPPKSGAGRSCGTTWADGRVMIAGWLFRTLADLGC